MADFTVKQSLSSPSSTSDGLEPEAEPEEYQTQQPIPTSPVLFQSSPSTAARSGRRKTPRATPTSAPSSDRKPRGRPPGSKNKPKPPIYITRETEPAMKTQLLEIPAGCDIVEMVQRFAIKNRFGVHVINGSGSVSSFTLRQPAINLSGAFNLLCLSGTFVGASICSSSSISHGGSAPWLTIFVGGNAGEVFGGTAVGKVVAASSVLLNVNTFSNYEYHRLEPAELEEEEEEEEEERQGRKQITGGGVAAMGPVGFTIPAEHLNWVAPTASNRSPHHHF